VGTPGDLAPHVADPAWASNKVAQTRT